MPVSTWRPHCWTSVRTGIGSLSFSRQWVPQAYKLAFGLAWWVVIIIFTRPSPRCWEAGGGPTKSLSPTPLMWPKITASCIFDVGYLNMEARHRIPSCKDAAQVMQLPNIEFLSSWEKPLSNEGRGEVDLVSKAHLHLQGSPRTWSCPNTSQGPQAGSNRTVFCCQFMHLYPLGGRRIHLVQLDWWDWKKRLLLSLQNMWSKKTHVFPWKTATQTIKWAQRRKQENYNESKSRWSGEENETSKVPMKTLSHQAVWMYFFKNLERKYNRYEETVRVNSSETVYSVPLRLTTRIWGHPLNTPPRNKVLIRPY